MYIYIHYREEVANAGGGGFLGFGDGGGGEFNRNITIKVLVYEVLSYSCMRPEGTSV